MGGRAGESTRRAATREYGLNRGLPIRTRQRGVEHRRRRSWTAVFSATWGRITGSFATFLFLGGRATFRQQFNALPYPPSWVDRFTARVSRLPFRGWILYFVLGILLVIFETSLLFIGELDEITSLFPPRWTASVSIVVSITLIHYLDASAEQALIGLRRRYKLADELFLGLRYRLTTLPALTTIVISLGNVIFFAAVVWLTSGAPRQLSAISPSRYLIVYFIYGLAGAWIYGTFIYHVLHQMLVIYRLPKNLLSIDLFDLRPLYMFSRLTAVSALGVLAINVPIFMSLPVFGTSLIGLVVAVINVLLAAAVFVLPLVGIHQRLAIEKGEALSRCLKRLQESLREMHKRLDVPKQGGLEEINTALEGLALERDTPEGLATWPWQKGTFQGMLVALSMPVAVWFILWIIQRFIGP